MNIIFLDVDGVLNSMPFHKITNKELSDIYIERLSRIYHSVEDCKIVLASTWRIISDVCTPEEIEIYEKLVHGLDNYNMKIYDKTPIINYNRPLEIQTWLNDHPGEHKFCILDDDFSEKDYKKYNLESHLVHTNYFAISIDDGGLQEKHVLLAKRIMR